MMPLSFDYINFGNYEIIHKDKFVVYSFKEGALEASKLFTVALIFAIISTIIALLIGVRKKDSIIIFATNVITKSILVLLSSLMVFSNTSEYIKGLQSELSIFTGKGLKITLVMFIISIVVEGLIYKKLLKYKKNGFLTSIICNVLTGIIYFLIIKIFLIVINS